VDLCYSNIHKAKYAIVRCRWLPTNKGNGIKLGVVAACLPSMAGWEMERVRFCDRLRPMIGEDGRPDQIKKTHLVLKMKKIENASEVEMEMEAKPDQI
jgi:hypothetical protein